MISKKISKRTIERSAYKNYLKKASEFYEVMHKSKNLRMWNAVGLNAVHCAISSADALLVFYAGIRSTSSDHLSVINLLTSSVQIPEIKSKAETLRKILVKKNLIEYEDRDFIQKEALEILKLTDRFYNWIVSKVG